MKKIIVLYLVSVLLACSEPALLVPEIVILKSAQQFNIVATGELEAVKSTPITATAKTQRPQTIAWIIEQYSYVEKDDVIVKFDGIPYQLEVDAAEYEMSKLMFNREKKQRELNLSLDDFSNEEEVVNFEYLMAQKFNIDDPLLYTKIEMIDASDNEEFLKAKSQHLKVMESHYQDKSEAEVGLIDSQSQLQKSKVDLNKDNLSQLEVKAPHSGIVVLKKGWDGALPQAGKSIFPGMKIASLPNLTQMKAKIYVPEIEAVGIKMDQNVDIQLHAFPNLKFSGKVSSISKTAQPKKRDNPIKYFIVSVVLDQQDEKRLLPGQRLEATIYTSDHDQAIIAPIQTIYRKETDSWVYLKDNGNGEFKKNPVKTGLCSTSQCVIISGLNEGDVIALTDPTEILKESK
jgi:RND family efflux transporter MFP subunit